MLAILRSAQPPHLWRFEFGPPSGPPEGLEPFLRWVLADYPARYEEQWRVSSEESVRVLARWLDTADTDEERRDIITAIGFYFEQSGADPLLPWLGHTDPRMRAVTVRALGRTAVFDTVPSVAAVLDDPDADVRLQAVIALGTIEHHSALPFLDATAVKHPDLASAIELSRALIVAGEAGDERTSARLLLASDRHDDAIRLALVDFPSMPAILLDTAEPPLVRARAARAIGIARHKRTGLVLLKVVPDPTTPMEVRVAAVEALGRLGSSNASEFLLPLLDDPQLALQEAAVTAIGRVRDARAFLPLVAKWDDHGGALRRRLDVALRQVCTETGSDDLTARFEWTYRRDPELYFITDNLELRRGYRPDLVRGELSSPDPLARKDAAVLLSYFGDASDGPRLEALHLGDPVEEIRWIAAIGLREMRRRGLPV